MALLRTLAKLIAHAIDQERRAEAGDHERSELERKTLSREVLLREISHDLRAPLTVVRGAAELLARGDNVDAQVAMTSGMIVGASVRMTSMLDGLLDAEAHDAGIEQERSEAIDLASFLEELAADTRAMLASQTVEVRVDGGGVVVAPPERLRRVLTNLTGNSARHTRSGTITLRARVVDDACFLEVEDTGGGMDPESLAALAAAFAKGEGSTGFGLGLSIVQRLTLAMGGTVAFASEEGVGTTTTLFLPLGGPASSP